MLKGKTVLITGSSRGVGRKIATDFASLGSNIVLNARNPIPDELVKEIQNQNVNTGVFLCDIQYYAQAEKLVSRVVEKFGRIDILINCAGITQDNLIVKMNKKQFNEVININLIGTFNMIKHVSRVMLKQKEGTIINISSISGVIGNIGQSNYSASKAGIIGLTKSVAKELAKKNITCNAIAPGLFDTDMSKKMSEKSKALLVNNIPMKRLGSLDDISNTAIFLANSSYITGQVINVDGGIVMNG